MRKNTGETKVHKTLTMPISFYALVEQIRHKQGMDTAEDAIKACVMQTARKLGLEAWSIAAGLKVNFLGIEYYTHG